MLLNDWINNKLSDVAKKLPTLVNKAPESFACGYQMGYKHALLDLDKFLQDEAPDDIEDFFQKDKWDL